MPAKYLLLSNVARKKGHKLPKKIKVRLEVALLEIKRNPLVGVQLHGELTGNYKYRMGDYRVVYSFDAKKSLVVILKIEHRQGVYR